MYLFATDTITNPLKPQPSKALLARLSQLSRDQQHITTITVGEIVYGAARSSRPKYHLERLASLILSQVQVLAFDEAAAFQYGTIRADLK